MMLRNMVITKFLYMSAKGYGSKEKIILKDKAL